jgi:telomere length regulation protein
VNVGIFPSSSTIFTTQSCFWKSTLPTIRRRLKSEDDSYSTFFSDIIQAIPSALTQQTILGSLLASLKKLPFSLDASPRQRGVVKQEANLLREIVGRLNSKSQELWENTSAVFLNREWDEGCGRYLVCWAAGAGADAVDTAGVISTSLSVSYVRADKFQLSKFSYPKSSISGLLRNILNTPYFCSINVCWHDHQLRE